MTVFRVMRASSDDAGGGGGDGRLVRGRYRLEGVLGRGTLGTVHRALDIEQGRPVALKIFDPALDPEGDAARRLLADLETASGLLNPHLVPALDAGVVDDRLFVVEPLLEGQSIAERLARGPLPPMETVRLALEVLVALDAMHRHLLNHFDLHPGNIFVVRDPVGLERVLVGGVGQHHALALDNARGRASGETRARPEYLAPEIISGRPRDVRTDLYQLGLVMYAALTGAPPFVGSDPAKVARRHALERPASPQNKRPDAGVPDALDMIVVRCLEKIARKRYSSAMDLTRDLEQVARKGAPIGESGRFRAVSFSEPPAPPSSEPPPRRPLTGSLGGSPTGSLVDLPERRATGSLDGRSPAGSVEDPPPFADFDDEPPPAGPQTQLDVRKLLSPPPKLTQPPRFGDGGPPPAASKPRAADPPAGSTAERRSRATPPIASGPAPVDGAPPEPEAGVTPAFGADPGGLSQTAVSSKTLVDPLFRPPLRPPEERDDKDDTGAHDLGGFPGAALVGTDDGRGVDDESTRAPTASVDHLKRTMVGGPRPGMEAAVEADLSGRTAFDGGAASKAAAAAAVADGAADATPDPAVEGRPAVDGPAEAPTEETPARAEQAPPAADDGPSELGAAAAADDDEGWSVGAGAVEDDIAQGLPSSSKAPWIVAALALIGLVAFALTRGADDAVEPDGEEPPGKISINTQAPEPPEPPPEPEGPDTAAIEARARAALAAEKWRGAPDALAESLAALREAAPDAPAARALADEGAGRLLALSRAAVKAGELDPALARARDALAVAPGFAPAEAQIAEVARLRAEAVKQATQAEAEQKAAAAAAQAEADRARVEQETAARQKAAREKAEREEAEARAAREKAEQAQAARAKAAEAEKEKAARAKAEEEEAARAKAEKEKAAREEAEAERRAQAERERQAREEAAAAARAEAEEAARAQARDEARSLLREGRDHVRGARWADARRAFERALERDGRLAAAHAGLGEVAFQEQRFADAVTHHRRAVQGARRNAGYHVNLGLAYYKLQNFAQAKASWDKALELDPDNAKAQRYLKVIEKKL